MALSALVLPLAALTFVLPASAPAVATQLVAHAPIDLFRGPGEGFDRSDTVAADSKVTVLWCTGDASWCLVQAGAFQGWAPSASLISRPSGSSATGSGTTTSATAGDDTGTYYFMFPLTEDIAKALEIETKRTGLLVAYKPEPEVLAKFADGTYTGFSMEGARVTFEEHDDGN